MRKEQFKAFIRDYDNDIQLLYINKYDNKINLEEAYNGDIIKKLDYHYPKSKVRDYNFYNQWLNEVQQERGIE